MQQEQIKTLLVNILTGAVILGVFVVGYFVFAKKENAVITSVTSVARIAEETASIGVEIDATVRDLKELADAVARAKIIFDLPEFMNLQNFSAPVTPEPVGRLNPFVPTEWKLKMKSSEESAGKSSATSQSAMQSASVSDDQPQPPTRTSVDVNLDSQTSSTPVTPVATTPVASDATPPLFSDFDTGL